MVAEAVLREAGQPTLKASEKTKETMFERLLQRYKDLPLSQKLLLSVGLTLASGAGLLVGGIVGTTFLAATAVARAGLGLLAGNAAGIAAYEATHRLVTNYQGRHPWLRFANPKALGYIAAGLVAYGVGRSLSHWGEAGVSLLTTAEHTLGASAAIAGEVGSADSLGKVFASAFFEFGSATWEALDYSKIWNEESKVFFYGETHGAVGQKIEILNHLSEFRSRGMTHVAFEVFSAKQAAAIEAFMNNTMSEKDFRKVLGYGWSYDRLALKKNIEILKTCQQLGITVVGLNWPSEGYATMATQNEQWAKIIGGICERDSHARVLVIGGANHSGYGGSVPSANEVLEERYGVRSTVTDIVGGGYSGPNYGDARASLLLDQYQSRRPADYMIYLPPLKAPLTS